MSLSAVEVVDSLEVDGLVDQVDGLEREVYVLELSVFFDRRFVILS